MTTTPDPIREVEALTRRQREVLALLAKGLTNPQIGERLGISRDGAKWHVGEILLRLGVDSREEAADLWRRYNGLPCRLRRIPRRIAGSLAVRWLAGGVGAGVVVAGAIVVVGAFVHEPHDTPLATTAPGATPTVTATTGTAGPTPSVVVATYPRGTRTGATADQVIDAIESGDPQQLYRIVGGVSMACVAEPLGIGSPPKCPAGTPEGSLVAVVRGGCPEVSYQLLTDFEKDPRMPGVGKALFAIARLSGPADPDDHWPAGDTQVFFADPVTGEGESVILADGAVINRLFACGNSAVSLWSNVAPGDVILPPRGTFDVAPAPGPDVTPTDGRPATFVSYAGVFQVTRWDDRNLPERKKAEDPVYNPAWPGFSACLGEHGLEVRIDPSQPFSQSDMDRLVARLNVEYPDRETNNKLLFAPGDDASNFLDCADAWLTKSPQEIYELTGVPNRWWPPDATVTP